jgi:hypothetical protein
MATPVPTPHAGRHSVQRLLIAAGLLLLLASSGIPGLAGRNAAGPRPEAFQPHVAGWIALAAAPRSTGPLSLHGGVAVVDQEQGVLDAWADDRLAPELRPATPGHVGSVALCRPERRQTGWTRDPLTGDLDGEAWQDLLHVTLVDVAAGRVLDQRTFEGLGPDRAAGSVDDAQPRSALLGWLAGLPRR